MYNEMYWISSGFMASQNKFVKIIAGCEWTAPSDFFAGILDSSMKFMVTLSFISSNGDQCCKQDQIIKTKTKVTRTRPRLRLLLTRPRPRPK